MPTMKNESRQKRQLNDFSRDSFLILIPGSFFPFWFPPISILGRLWHESEFFCFILLCKCIVPWFSINVYLRIRSWKERRKKERRSFRIMSCFFFFLNARNETARCTATAGLGWARPSLLFFLVHAWEVFSPLMREAHVTPGARENNTSSKARQTDGHQTGAIHLKWTRSTHSLFLSPPSIHPSIRWLVVVVFSLL
jgi:hypothetical protein